MSEDFGHVQSCGCKKKLEGVEAPPEIDFFFLSDQMGSKNMQHFDGWDVEKRKGLSAAPLVTNLFVFFTTSANLGNALYHLKILIPTSCQPPTIVDISLTGKLGSTLLTCGGGGPPTPKIRLQK